MKASTQLISKDFGVVTAATAAALIVLSSLGGNSKEAQRTATLESGHVPAAEAKDSAVQLTPQEFKDQCQYFDVGNNTGEMVRGLGDWTIASILGGEPVRMWEHKSGAVCLAHVAPTDKTTVLKITYLENK